MKGNRSLYSSGFSLPSDIEKKYQRIFILYSNTGATAPIFTPKNMATKGGRMDVVARALIAALMDQQTPRNDALFISVLMGPPSPPRILYIPGSYVRDVIPSEYYVGKLIIDILKSPVFSEKTQIYDIVNFLKKKNYHVLLLIEDGEDIIEFFSKHSFHDKRFAFIVGDHIGFPTKLAASLKRMTVPLSLSSVSYLASHCIFYVNEILDRLLTS